MPGTVPSLTPTPGSVMVNGFPDGPIVPGVPIVVNGEHLQLTQMVAVFFEDSKVSGNGDLSDIRVCVQGQFGYSQSTRTIYGASETPVQIKLSARKKASAACTHKFHIEHKSPAGVKLNEQSFSTNSNNNFNETTIMLGKGETINLSWSSSYKSCDTGGQRDPHTRTVSNAWPVPKVDLNQCPDAFPALVK
jgi:hypothetical protein